MELQQVLHTALPQEGLPLFSPGDLLGPLLPHSVPRAGCHETTACQPDGDSALSPVSTLHMSPSARPASLTCGGVCTASLLEVHMLPPLPFEALLHHRDAQPSCGLGLRRVLSSVWSVFLDFCIFLVFVLGTE